MYFIPFFILKIKYNITYDMTSTILEYLRISYSD